MAHRSGPLNQSKAAPAGISGAAFYVSPLRDPQHSPSMATGQHGGLQSVGCASGALAAPVQDLSLPHRCPNNFDDPDHSKNEERLITVGFSSHGCMLVVGHAERGDVLVS